MTSAKNRDISVNITSYAYKCLIDLGCAYCGIELHTMNGTCLDRIDNKQGYFVGNVTPCCRRCNVAKNDMTSDEFFDWIERVSNFTQMMIKKLNTETTTMKQLKKMENVFNNCRKNKNSSQYLLDGKR
jgi:hypothetical protein